MLRHVCQYTVVIDVGIPQQPTWSTWYNVCKYINKLGTNWTIWYLLYSFAAMCWFLFWIFQSYLNQILITVAHPCIVLPRSVLPLSFTLIKCTLFATLKLKSGIVLSTDNFCYSPSITRFTGVEQLGNCAPYFHPVIWRIKAILNFRILHCIARGSFLLLPCPN